MISGTPFKIVDIDGWWSRICPLVEGVDPRDNAGHDLRQDCRDGRALCLVSESDGVLVVSLQPDRYGSGDLELFIRMGAAWGERGSIQRNEAHFDAIAKEMGATKVVLHTLRPGMTKVLGPAWQVRYTAFERPVHG